MGVFRTIVERAVKDKRFRAALTEDPKSAIAKEFGIELPDDVKVQVHENSPKDIHIVLPNPLEPTERRPLTREELEQVAGRKLSPAFATAPCTNTWCRRIG
jgi:nitrile hydratase alpha subunit